MLSLLFRNEFKVVKTDRIFQAAPLTFDPSIVEIFTGLFAGATLVMVPNSVKTNPPLLGKILMEQKVTIMQVRKPINFTHFFSFLRRYFFFDLEMLKF